MTNHDPVTVRLAEASDAEAVAVMLDRFNREFDEPTPGPAFLTARLAELIGAGQIDVLVGGEGPDGFVALSIRPSLMSSGAECYVAELYVAPEHRGRGIGRAIMEEAVAHARRRGTDYMFIGVDEPDRAARNLYESLGFSNRENGPDGPLMFVYERDL